MIVSKINKKHLKNDKLFSTIEKENKNIRKEIEKYLKNNGLVLARKKDGMINSLSFFEAEDDYGKELKHTKDVFIKELDDTSKEKIINGIKESIREHISYNEFIKVTWDDEKYELKKSRACKNEIYAVGPIFIFVGVAITLITDNFIGITLGFTIGILYSILIIILNKKNKEGDCYGKEKRKKRS